MSIEDNATQPEEPKGPVRHILLIEDEPDHCEMIEECLTRSSRERIEVTIATTVREACDRLDTEKYDLVLLDHNLPDGHGSDILEEMDYRLLTTPVIGLSTSTDPEVALADFRGGAIEFIPKHEAFKADALRRRIVKALATYKRRMTANALERNRQDTAIQQTDDELIAAARMDPLMGIFNRAAFEDLHSDMHTRTLARKGTYALCMVDVDRFKLYNDRYGHASGDDVLRQVGHALRATVRPEDAVARFGGEEIVILLDAVTSEVAERAVTRLLESIIRLQIMHESNGEYGQVTASIGAAIFDPDSEETESEIVRRADAALYRAKFTGRNRVVIADPVGAATGQAAA